MRTCQPRPLRRAWAEEIADASPGAELDPAVFFTEPWNPAAYCDQFQQAGFAVAAYYESRIVEGLSATRPRAQALAARVAAGGICIRALNVRRFEEELQALFRFTATVFRGNPFYRPIELSAFRELYRPLLPVLDPELVRLALDREGRMVGYILALPDLLSGGGGRPDRVVLKTLATTPGARRLGLGACLADEVHRLADEKGYRAVIHALMHQENASVWLSRRYGSRLFRRYALCQWSDRDLAPAH